VTEAGAPTLRWHRGWRAAGWILVLAIVIGSLIPLGQRGMFAGFDKVEHLVGYALLMYWFAALHAPARRIWFALAFVALGGALELAQGATGWRNADSLDLLADAVGVALGWALARGIGVAPFDHVERAAR
jgi:hypothetical protein